MVLTGCPQSQEHLPKIWCNFQGLFTTHTASPRPIEPQGDCNSLKECRAYFITNCPEGKIVFHGVLVALSALMIYENEVKLVTYF